MKCVRWMGAALLGSLSVVACGKESDQPGGSSDPKTCGEMMCSDRQECNESGREPRCKCTLAYQGDECESCAPGYEEVADACKPVEIDCDDNPCGLRGACVSPQGKADFCECNEFHTGPTCDQCADGYQDNDEDGECAVGCDSADLSLSCEGFWVCDDSSGEAECTCPVGSAGDECELCEDGYARRGDSPCYKICSSPDFECSEPSFCFDDEGRQPAQCVCPVGYQGESCDVCAEGFEKQGEYCIRTDMTGFDLLTLGAVQGRTAVVGIDSATGDLKPLLAVEGTPEGLAYDANSGALYVANYQGVHSADWETGELTSIASAQIGHGKPLAFDPDSNLLYSHRSSEDVLFTVDPSNGTTSDIGSTTVSWMWDATYRVQDDSIYALRSQGLAPSIFSIDPSDATATEIGSVEGSESIGREAMGGLAALSSGELAVLTRMSMDTEAAIQTVCQKVANRFGLDDYENAPSTIDLQENTPNTVLISQGTSGKELVIYRSYGGTGDNVLTLAVENPEAFVCILTYEENFQIIVNENAQWAGGIIYSYESTIEGVVPSGFSTDAPLLAGGGSNVDLSALESLPEAFRVVSSAEFSDRRLPPLSDFDSYSRTESPYVLRLLSLPDLARQSEVQLEGKFKGGLAAY